MMWYFPISNARKGMQNLFLSKNIFLKTESVFRRTNERFVMLFILLLIQQFDTFEIYIQGNLNLVSDRIIS